MAQALKNPQTASRKLNHMNHRLNLPVVPCGTVTDHASPHFPSQGIGPQDVEVQLSRLGMSQDKGWVYQFSRFVFPRDAALKIITPRIGETACPAMTRLPVQVV